MARALSFLRGRDYVDPAVVRELAIPVLAHRLILKSEMSGAPSVTAVINDILANQRTPR
jgi:MoxR-like ATPase